MTDEHAALPVHIPNLSHLSVDELQSLRNKASNLVRDARRKATSAIQRVKELKTPWMKALALKSACAPEERAQVMGDFERELLRNPEAFFAHAYANSLLLIDTACRDELLRRGGEVRPKKKTATSSAVPAPPVVAASDEGEVFAAIRALEEQEEKEGSDVRTT